MVEYIEGILKIANFFLSIIAMAVAIAIFNIARKDKKLRAWQLVLIALIFFSIQEILGALRAFNIFTSPYLTHINPTIILGFLIWALILQINLKGK
ncbi:MAG: hypothetical protein KAU20_01005 [Nanoarchaeota archaeon]|nr:hypothetical protein [Nanoarchaeota archaeon]